MELIGCTKYGLMLTSGFWQHIIPLNSYLTSLSRESVVLGSALVACLANHVWFTRALSRMDITVLVVRASRVTVAGLKL